MNSQNKMKTWGVRKVSVSSEVCAMVYCYGMRRKDEHYCKCLLRMIRIFEAIKMGPEVVK